MHSRYARFFSIMVSVFWGVPVLCGGTADEAQPTLTLQEQLKGALPLLADDGIKLDENLTNEQRATQTLYFGTGLCTTKQMSDGIPFDFLGLLATAEEIRKICGFGKIIHLLADSHAKTNHFVSEADVDKKAQEFKALFIKIAKNLGLEGKYELILASEIDNTPEYTNIYAGIPADGSHPYALKEWTDMEYLAQKRKTRLKLSWMLPLRKGKKHESDEIFFDSGFNKEAKFTRSYSFVYNRAGMTFDPDRLNVSPYTYVAGEKRLLIDSTQDATKKLAEFMVPAHKAKEKALAQLETQVTFIEKTFNITVPEDTSEKGADKDAGETVVDAKTARIQKLGKRVNAIVQKILH